jgi:osmoprotectant transport system permease protein
MVGDLFGNWMRVFTQPNVESFTTEKEHASASKLLLGLGILGLAIGLTKIPTNTASVSALLSLLTAVFTVVVDFVVIAFILFIVVQLAGGDGSFLTHCYALSLPLVPTVIAVVLFGRAAGLAAPVLGPLAPLGIDRLVQIGLAVYGSFLGLLALQAAHGLKASHAVNVVLATLVIWAALNAGAMFVARAENVVTKTGRFMWTNRARLLDQGLSHAWLVIFSMVIAIVLGVIIGILITLPSRSPRLPHLLALVPLALFLFIYLGGGGTLGPGIENGLEAITRRAQGFGVIGVVLVVVLYVLFIFGERAAEPVLYVAGILLTFPSIGLFGLFIPLFGIGFMNAAIALILYAQLPILRNTYTGIKEVPGAVIESARGMGMTEWQILRKIKVPMTVPVIMAGVRISMVMIVGIAAIAKLIGVKTLGKYIFDGIGRGSDPMVLAGAIGVSLFALLVDGLLGWAQDAFTPAGLRERPS